MIKYIDLKNFQRHKDLKIELSDGINVICGKTDTGKSSIRRAIDWCIFGITVNGIITQGEKQCSVEIGLDNGVVIKRVRSKSINRYILMVDGEEKTFDSIGKNIPEDITKAIGINSLMVDGEEIILNSQPQLGLPFLFDKSPSFRAKILNKMTGNDVLDILFGDYNKDILRCQKEIKRENSIFDKRKEEISEKETLKEKKEVLYNKINKLYIVCEKGNEKLDKLLKLKDLSISVNNNYIETNKELNIIKIPQVKTLEELVTKITKLNATKTALISTKTLLTDVADQKEKIIAPTPNFVELNDKIARLSKLNPLMNNSLRLNKDKDIIESSKIELPKIDIDSVLVKAKRLNNINKIFSELDKSKEILYTLTDKIKNEDSLYKKEEIEYKTILKELGVCPLCGSEITEKHKH